jgi:hypothetical protein
VTAGGADICVQCLADADCTASGNGAGGKTSCNRATNLCEVPTVTCDGDKGAATGSNLCKSETAKFCVAGVCKECNDSASCSVEEKPVCSANACVKCENDYKEDGSEANMCPEKTKPTCKIDTGKCEAATGDGKQIVAKLSMIVACMMSYILA